MVVQLDERKAGVLHSYWAPLEYKGSVYYQGKNHHVADATQC